jgi:hypothetical protein
MCPRPSSSTRTTPTVGGGTHHTISTGEEKYGKINPCVTHFVKGLFVCVHVLPRALDANPADRVTGHPSTVTCQQGIFFIFFIFFGESSFFFKKL